MTYLDYAATAVPRYRVSDFDKNWFNPNSHYAIDECLDFEKCEDRVKEAIGTKSGKVIFGGNASWFFEKLYNNQGSFWLGSPYEHDCIYKNELEVNNLSKIHFSNEIYCHQLVNNITGQIFPVQEIGRYVKDRNGYFICDTTAGVGKVLIPDNIDNWCDCLVASSHKFGVDNKQIGFAWLSDRFFEWLRLYGSVINGYSFIDGTPDLACVKATTEAVVDACKNVEKYNQHYNKLSYYLEANLMNTNIDYDYIITKEFTNAINAIMLPSINANSLCHYLSFVHQVYISPGHSACEENSGYRVLKKYGLSQEECESTIRVSFGPETTKQDIETLVNGIKSFKEKYYD